MKRLHLFSWAVPAFSKWGVWAIASAIRAPEVAMHDVAATVWSFAAFMWDVKPLCGML